MWENAKHKSVTFTTYKHSIKMSQIGIISKQLAFVKFHFMVNYFITTFACLILARDYNFPRTASIKVLTLSVAAEPTFVL